MDVGQVAVVRALDRHDREEVRRPQLRDLDRGERPIADAPHPDRAGAPGLGREPLDRVVPVTRLDLGVLVHRDAGRGAGAPDIDPDEDVAASREPLAAPVSALRRQLSLPYGIISRMAGNRRSTSSSPAGTGRQTFADSSVPSRVGIRTSQSTVTAWIGGLAGRAVSASDGAVMAASLRAGPCAGTPPPVACDDAGHGR